MKAIFLSLLFIVIFGVTSFASCTTNKVATSIYSGNSAPCWAEAHYYGLAQDANGDLIPGCHIVLILVKCKFDPNDPAPDLLAWGFVAVGDCPRELVLPEEVFYSSNGIKVGYSLSHSVSNQDNLKTYLGENPHMKIVVADAAVEVIPK